MIHPLATLAAAALLLLQLAACRGPAAVDSCASLPAPALELPALDLTRPGVSPGNLRAWVELLASPRLEGRHAGDPGARTVAALLAAQMAAFELAPPGWGTGYCQGFLLLDDEDYNVVAHLTAGQEARPLVLVAAHYDGQGLHPAGMFYPSADDNASGVAALLEVARIVRRRENGPEIGWVFAALGGEETAQQGARAYLAAPSIDLSRVELVINLDMVGRPLPGESSAIGYRAMGPSPEATEAVLHQAAASAGLEIRSLEGFGDSKPTISDAEIFATRLPTVLLSTALHEDHHQLTDTPERIDYGQVERAVRLVLGLADSLMSREAESS